MNLGQKFKQIRKLNNLSQEQLAQKTGISQQAISLWERNERTPNMIDCIKLADFYDISLDELVGRDEQRTGNLNNTIIKKETLTRETIKIRRKAK